MPPVRLFIGNLPYQATEEDLRTHFSQVGEPTQIVRPLDRETGRARGFAFVEFAERAPAEEAIRRFDGQLFMGRPLAVSEARAREDRGPGGPRPGGPRPGGGFGGPRPGGGGGFSGPRPGGGGGFGGPRPGGAPGSGPPNRDFGPPAPPKKKGAKNAYSQKERGPKGPIPTKFTGRMYDLDDVAEDDANDELPDFMRPETDLPAEETERERRDDEDQGDDEQE
ncbi:MAG: RNA recognition motif domain-containing protein [Vicinamibacterales bacterium]